MKNLDRKKLIAISWRVGLAIILIVALILARELQSNPDFCEQNARGFARGYVFIASRITNVLPFSLTEVFYVVGICSIIAIVVSVIRLLIKKDFFVAIRRALNVGCIVVALILLYTFVFTLSYTRHSAIDYLDLQKVEEMNVDLCAEASIYYAEEVKRLADELQFDEKGDVICPYTFDELQALINEEYHRFDGGYLADFEVKAKPVLMSKVMSYSGITGQFFCYFGESNVSTDLPGFTIAETVAHELAHAKGVARENEANFIAYYLLLTSDDPYLRYSGMMTAANKLLFESYDKNNDSAYRNALPHFTDEMWTQYENVNVHWDSYDTFWDDVMEKLNDSYLKGQGQPSGVKSYSQTGEFLLSIYLTEHKGQ